MIQNAMNGKGKKLLIFIVLIAMVMTILILYPLYVQFRCARYARDFAVIFNAGNINRIDKLLDDNTEIAVGEAVITYQEARDNIEKIITNENFATNYSYGFIKEDSSKYNNTLLVLLFWPIEGVGIIEGEICLERKYFFWYKVKKIKLEDRKEYCKKMFWGEE